MNDHEIANGLFEIAEHMRTNSERWFPDIHREDFPIPLWLFYSIGHSEEAGEVLGEGKKLVRGRSLHPDQDPARRAKLVEEMADSFTYLMLLANELDVDLIYEYRRKEAKNEQRFGIPAGLRTGDLVMSPAPPVGSPLRQEWDKLEDQR